MRAEQREATREQIVSAALMAISEAGFDGVSTRAIAERANVSQGLLTYHFKSKDALWRAAADHLFAMQTASIREALSALELAETNDPREQRRELIRQFVFFSAAHPEFMRFMLESGKQDNERSRWLADTYVGPMYQQFAQVMNEIPKADLPHAFYAVAGASSLIFCASGECERVTGKAPNSKAAVKRHADYLANLMVPD